MNEQERQQLVDEATSAWRPRTPDGRILEHPAWADLDRAGREAAFEEAIVQRVLESALHEDGYSTTVRAVMAAIRPAT